ncbi:hypothetical protein MMC19_006020 [Ptychographa xylographoides]|nr:hypothetical protein [Ptychographa xylographoides]
MADYPKHPRSTIHRHRERAAYDFSTVHSIVNACSILHVSFLPPADSDSPFPTTLPMIGTMGSFAAPDADPTTSDEPMDVYIHGHSASRLMKLPTSPSASGSAAGVPVCVSATILDGILLALTPFNHSCNYRSAVLHGNAEVVDDAAEKMWAMQLITDGLVPCRWEHSRVPPTKAEMTSTTVLRIRVASASAKVHVGGPSDDRKDLKDEEMRRRVWTGVVPVQEVLGECVVGENNLVKGVPAYLEAWRTERNEAGERYVKENAVNKPK